MSERDTISPSGLDDTAAVDLDDEALEDVTGGLGGMTTPSPDTITPN